MKAKGTTKGVAIQKPTAKTSYAKATPNKVDAAGNSKTVPGKKLARDKKISAPKDNYTAPKTATKNFSKRGTGKSSSGNMD